LAKAGEAGEAAAPRASIYHRRMNSGGWGIGAVTVRRAALGAALALAALPGAAGGHDLHPAAQTSVIGGRPASIADFPSLAYIATDNGRGGGFACSGTVVAPRVVLTAGHCVENPETGGLYPADEYGVRTGVADLADTHSGQVSRVSRVLVSPFFRLGTLHGDAGLLILSAPVAAPPIPLAGGSDGALYEAGTPLRIAGWGLTKGDGRRTPSILQSAETLVQGPDYCKRRTKRTYPFFSPEVQLCAVDPPAFATGTCKGDSGGPALAARPDGRLVEVGITSLGAEDCSTRLPGVFTRVDRMSAWAGEWIAAVEAGGPAPAIVKHKPHLPFLSRPVAKILAFIGLGQGLGDRFRHGKAKRIACGRIARSKVKCGVSWYQGPNDYFGTVTVYLVVNRSEVAWDDRFKINWVNDRCWFSSGHRRSCRIHTQVR
jgi:secreted trypsin-like serine protease